MSVIDRKGFLVFHQDFILLAKLSFDEKGRLFDALYRYSAFGEEPKFSGMLEVFWPYFANKIDEGIARYAATCERNRKAANARWSNENACKRMQVDADACKRMQVDAFDANKKEDKRKKNVDSVADYNFSWIEEVESDVHSG